MSSVEHILFNFINTTYLYYHLCVFFFFFVGELRPREVKSLNQDHRVVWSIVDLCRGHSKPRLMQLSVLLLNHHPCVHSKGPEDSRSMRQITEHPPSFGSDYSVHSLSHPPLSLAL